MFSTFLNSNLSLNLNKKSSAAEKTAAPLKCKKSKKQIKYIYHPFTVNGIFFSEL